MRSRRLMPLVVLAVLVVAGGSAADVRIPFREVQENVVPHPEAADRPGTCSIVYYNICSHSTYHWGWGIGDNAGVIFDLTADCQKVPGESCTNEDFWWYWRFTFPGYGRTVTYGLYRVDSAHCLIEPPIGSLANQDPVERWNHYAGLGTVMDDSVALTVDIGWGGGPMLVTDNNVGNQQAGCAPVPSEIHSWAFRNMEGPLCPPAWYGDALGPVNVLMDARFSCEPTAVEHASWGAIKSLFR